MVSKVITRGERDQVFHDIPRAMTCNCSAFIASISLVSLSTSAFDLALSQFVSNGFRPMVQWACVMSELAEVTASAMSARGLDG